VKRAITAFVLGALGVSAMSAAIPVASSQAPATPPPLPSAPGDPVIQWNRILLGIQATTGAQPATVHPTYDLAITHAAIYDAVVAINHSGSPYLIRYHGPRHASLAASADTAAHDALVRLYPNLKATIDSDYARLLAQVPAGGPKSQGITVGRIVAQRILAKRSNDGSAAPLRAFTAGTAPGDYQLTPPKFGSPVFTNWPSVRPFLIRRASQFRPPPPPALTSSTWTAVFNEVKALGVSQGSTRTPEQSQIAVFWNPPIWAAWNQIAQTVALGHHSTLSENARTFALLNVSFADSAIAFYDAKYAYHFWRPVTAIRNASRAGNPATVANPNWTPLVATAPDPSYPGAHSTISAAGAGVLSSVYGNRVAFTVTSPALPGVKRSFTRFSDAANEAGLSRIYNGNHTRIDHVAGQGLGHQVAGYVIRHFPSPR